jgi:hypothetical protein
MAPTPSTPDTQLLSLARSIPDITSAPTQATLRKRVWELKILNENSS